MTGGRVVILGEVGANFAAGMSGGVAYVLDPRHDLYLRVNKELVAMSGVTEKHDIQALRELIEEHTAATGSEIGREILENFDQRLPDFKKIMPKDFKRMLDLIASFEAKGMDREHAEIEAFYAMTGK